MTLEENNRHIGEMLEYFDDETENGKLYINYPMVESVFYTKQLPDKDYLSYDVTREKCHNFKALACDFSFYNSFEHLLISGNKNEKEEKKLLKQQTAKENWLHLTDMNVRKANFICVGVDAIPALKENIAQSNIYENQLAKYVNTESCRVSVLNSFPIFLYDYFRDIVSLC